MQIEIDRNPSRDIFPSRTQQFTLSFMDTFFNSFTLPAHFYLFIFFSANFTFYGIQNEQQTIADCEKYFEDLMKEANARRSVEKAVRLRSFT